MAKVGGACVRFLVPPPGELQEVTGVEEAFAQKGVRGIRIYRRPGHRFGDLRRGADRAGAVLAVGDSRDEALERAAKAEAMIRFEIDVDLFGVEVARRNLARADPQLQYSLTLFPEAESLMRLGNAPARAQR